jgi:molybdopterin synthase catalytic subunit
VHPSASSNEWIALFAGGLPAVAALEWVVVPGCGGNVVFTGTVRDHAEGRAGVEWLEYEAYEEQAVAKMEAVAATARDKWPTLGRIALLHRTGRLEVSDAAVVVAVSAPHRDEAFEAARFCIDTLKAEVPIWKKERWTDGEDWGHSAEARARPSV